MMNHNHDHDLARALQQSLKEEEERKRGNNNNIIPENILKEQKNLLLKFQNEKKRKQELEDERIAKQLQDELNNNNYNNNHNINVNNNIPNNYNNTNNLIDLTGNNINIPNLDKLPSWKINELQPINDTNNNNNNNNNIHVPISLSRVTSNEEIERIDKLNIDLNNNFDPYECPICHISLANSNGCLIGKWIEAGGRYFHNHCFRCNGCGGEIHGNFIPKTGEKWLEYEPYHRNCYDELFADRCMICKQAMTSVNDVTYYLTHPFFRDWKYCPRHQNENIRKCCSCHMPEPINDPFDELNDGRVLCLGCSNNVAIDNQDAQILYKNIVDFFRNILGVSLPNDIDNIPILLVDLNALNENDNYHGNSGGATTRGLCLSEVGHISHFTPTSYQFNSYTHQWEVERESTVSKIEETRTITAILILYGLPTDLTASIMSHELTHAYIKLDRSFPTNLDSQIEEGICQLLAYLYLRYQSDVKGDPEDVGITTPIEGPTQAQLRRYHQNEIQTHTSPIYGDGFRAAFAAYQSLGGRLDQLFDNIKKYGKFLP